MTRKKLTQHEMLSQWFKRGYTLTVAEALSMFGCYALSQRCGELKKKPWSMAIKSEMITTASGKRIARYSL